MHIGVAEMDREIINNLALFFVSVIVAFIAYFRRTPAIKDPIISSVGMGWMEREQTERMLRALDDQAKSLIRIADYLEKLTDQRSNNMSDRIDELMEQIKKMEAKPTPTRRR